MGPFESNVEASAAIGREWNSVRGRRKVIGTQDVGGSTRLQVSTDGEPYPELMPPSDLEREIARDEKGVKVRADAQQRTAASRTADDKAKSEREDTDGFADRFTPMARQKAIDALNTNVTNKGRLISRKALIRELVAKGYRVDRVKNRLLGPDGVFIDARALTKTGLDYADYLAVKGA